MAGHFQIMVKDIKRGDRFRGPDANRDDGWDAVSDAETADGRTYLKVRHVPDGGMAFREWIDPTINIKVLR